MKTRQQDPFQIPERWLALPVIAGILLIAGWAAYANSFHAAFHFDDRESILNTEFVRNYLDLPRLWQREKARFVAYLTFAVNYRMAGFNSFFYHAVNWLIHLMSAFGVFFLLRTIFQDVNGVSGSGRIKTAWMSLAGALFFLLHPVQTQAVTYIVQRMAALAALFYILSVLFYALGRKGRRGAYALSAVCAVLAFFTKENTVSLPAALLLYEVCFGGSGEGGRKRSLRQGVWILAISALLLGSVYGLVYHAKAAAQHGLAPALAQAVGAQISRGQYFLTQQSVVAHYLRLVVLPYGQNLDYDWPIAKSLLEPRTLAGALVLIGFLTAGIVCFKKGARAAAFGIFWFFIALSVESSIIPIKDVIFEHRLYLPMAGLACLFAVLLRKAAERWGQPVFLLTLISLIMGLLTFQRNQVWASSEALWTDVMHKSPRKSRPYINLGRVFIDQGDVPKAEKLLKTALEIDPDKPLLLYNAANIYKAKGQWEKALEYYLKTIEKQKNWTNPYANAAEIYMRLKNLDKAEEYFKKVIEMDPNFYKAYTNLAGIYADTGRQDAAIPLLTKAVDLLLRAQEQTGGAFSDELSLSIATMRLGRIYVTKGMPDQAIPFLDIAVSVNRESAKAYYWRALAYAMKGDPQKVMEQVRELQRLKSEAYLEALRRQIKLNQPKTVQHAS